MCNAEGDVGDVCCCSGVAVGWASAARNLDIGFAVHPACPTSPRPSNYALPVAVLALALPIKMNKLITMKPQERYREVENLASEDVGGFIAGLNIYDDAAQIFACQLASLPSYAG